jgi:hypothetical protein
MFTLPAFYIPKREVRHHRATVSFFRNNMTMNAVLFKKQKAKTTARERISLTFHSFVAFSTYSFFFRHKTSFPQKTKPFII